MIRSAAFRGLWPARAAAVLAALLLAIVTGALPAGAHAMLVETDPADGAVLDAPPDRVTLVFNEPVALATGGLRLFDGEGEPVATTLVDTGAPETVAVDLPHLDDGGYVVTWRVLSADSHPVAGAFVFTVGTDQAVDDDLVASLFGGEASIAVGIAGGLLRAAAYLGTLLAAGALLFAVAVARRQEDRDRARRLGIAGAAVGIAAAVLGLPVQATATTGMGAGALFQAGVLPETLASSFGISVLLRVGALAALALLWRARAQAPLLAAPASLAVAAFLVDGHTRTVEPALLMIAGDTVHLAAAAIWFGGLAVLLAAVRGRSLEDDPVGAARLLARFSRLAMWAVVALVAGGLAMSWPLVRVPRALVTTPYGWTLVTKVTVALLVIAVAVYNGRRLVPAIARRLLPAGGADDTLAAPPPVTVTALSRSAWRQLRVTAAVEAALIVMVLVVTGFLVSQRPAADAAGVTGLYETTAELTEELDVQLVVDPNRVGRNSIHLYVIDRTGRPAGDLDDLRLELSEPERDIGPFVREPFPAGPGHWVHTGDELAFPGRWTVRVVAGLDHFTEASVEIDVVVNP